MRCQPRVSNIASSFPRGNREFFFVCRLCLVREVSSRRPISEQCGVDRVNPNVLNADFSFVFEHTLFHTHSCHRNIIVASSEATGNGQKRFLIFKNPRDSCPKRVASRSSSATLSKRPGFMRAGSWYASCLVAAELNEISNCIRAQGCR
jgi:hypothetical protein